MKNLKLYSIGALALALVLGAASVSHADTTIAVGTAGGPQTIIYGGNSLSMSRVNTGNGHIDVLTVPGMAVQTTGSVAVGSNINLPGVPNTGPITSNSNSNSTATTDTSGMIRLRGMVSTVTPEALGFVSGNQTWTIRWAAGINSGAGLQAGDMIEVDGFIDTLYMSQINAVSIREI